MQTDDGNLHARPLSMPPAVREWLGSEQSRDAAAEAPPTQPITWRTGWCGGAPGCAVTRGGGAQPYPAPGTHRTEPEIEQATMSAADACAFDSGRSC